MDPATRAEIRRLAAAHVRELGSDAPPLNHRASLQARQLELLPDPLETVLADSNLPEEARDKIDGFIDLDGRMVCLRAGLHPHQYRLGLMHEIAHDVLPWQQEILHYCPIFSLPAELQHDFEREANLFAVECSFLADRFIGLVAEVPGHLRSAVAMAADHVMSFEATFRHFVECHPGRCVLLVSKLVDTDLVTGTPTFQVQYYVPSASANCRIPTRQRFATPELAARMNSNFESDGVVDHTVVFGGAFAGRQLVAQSFWNTYKLFTLVWL